MTIRGAPVHPVPVLERDGGPQCAGRGPGVVGGADFVVGVGGVEAHVVDAAVGKDLVDGVAGDLGGAAVLVLVVIVGV